MIRGSSKGCPFGLPIPYGCKNVGESIKYMSHKKEDDSSSEHNFNILFMSIMEGGSECPYADTIIKPENKRGGGLVDCKYSADNRMIPAGSSGLSGSALYPHWYVGDMYQPLKGMPLSYISDDNNYKEYFGSIYTDLFNAIV